MNSSKVLDSGSASAREHREFIHEILEAPRLRCCDVEEMKEGGEGLYTRRKAGR